MKRRWSRLRWFLGGLFTLSVAVLVAVYAVLAGKDFEYLRGFVQD